MGTGPAKWEVRARGQAVGRTGCRSWGGGLAQSSLTARRTPCGRKGWLGAERITQGPSRSDHGSYQQGPGGKPAVKTHGSPRACTHCPILNCQRDPLLEPWPPGNASLGGSSILRTRRFLPLDTWPRDPEGWGLGPPGRTAFHSFTRTTCSSPEIWLQSRDCRAGRGLGRVGALGTASPAPCLAALDRRDCHPGLEPTWGRWR